MDLPEENDIPESDPRNPLDPILDGPLQQVLIIQRAVELIEILNKHGRPWEEIAEQLGKIKESVMVADRQLREIADKLRRNRDSGGPEPQADQDR